MHRPNAHQLKLLIYAVTPALLAYLIFTVEIRTNYQRTAYGNGYAERWDSWHAYQHEWCYVVAAVLWFALIYWHLAKPKDDK